MICHVHCSHVLEGEFFFLIMSLTHLGLRIKRSCLRIYGELVSKEFSFQFSRNCMTPSLSKKRRFLLQWGANNLFRESQNFLRGAKALIRESQNSLWGTNSKLLWEAYKPNNGSKNNRLRETKACVNAFETALRDSECNDIIDTDCNTCLNRVDACEPKIPQCVKNLRHSRLCSKVVTRRVRNQELSRVP